MHTSKRTVLEQLNADFPADEISLEGTYLQVGRRFRAFLHADPTDLARTRAGSSMGRNYLLFLASFIYKNFRLIPAKDTLSYSLISEIEANRLQGYRNRLERFGLGVGYVEYWDGSAWQVKAVPYNDPDFQVRLPLQAPEDVSSGQDEEWEELEELEAVAEYLPEQEQLPLLYPPASGNGNL